ncbi:hypothetical protein F3Y22_tig00110633pilonHSYRG00110 [Hibiscus syriacus]|uniref:Uncharacterized protein n=1 Tax=Hibiscus syriacus TaxID=106335 RepID=A0A6A3A0J2_HIBSY|nr:hypothetical protein F3Y22_tig00110633pilonHSYRG00110 [Hibiscus syriacus]
MTHDMIQNLTSSENRSKSIPVGEICLLSQFWTIRTQTDATTRRDGRIHVSDGVSQETQEYSQTRSTEFDIDQHLWEVFKEFYRRVATYVVDWKDDQNAGSKDRAPGLGAKPVEPDDWSSRFCEVTDTGLKDMVLQNFGDPENSLLPWQTADNEITRLL